MAKKSNKSQKDIRRSLIESFSKSILEASQCYGKTPALITKAEYNEFAELSDWDIRKLGGFNNLKKVIFPFDDQDLSGIRENQRMKLYVSKIERELGDKQSFEKNSLLLIESALKNIKVSKVKLPKRKKTKSKKDMTMELQVSDVHYGKKTDTFNLEICRERMKALTTVFLKEMEQKEVDFNVEHVIIALIGDLLESSTMHGSESMIGCEFTNPKQMASAIESLFHDTILPIALTGVRITIPCITGNHDRHDPRKTYNSPGLNNLSFVIYKSLKLLAEASGLSNVEFIIPEDSFTILDIYGSNVLYEHGDELQNTTKNVILGHMEKRGRQVKKRIHMSRWGHWHEYVCYDRGAIIVNESVCGQDSYAKVKGYDSTAGQTINFYIDTESRPTSFYYSFPVYLG
ncbi:MAG: hypothetical protein COB41_00565 [Proteobacteria bacterium]|nr:MAG: hypothetical protein COB41_00565 [Pseudomonadota bacterium]